MKCCIITLFITCNLIINGLAQNSASNLNQSKSSFIGLGDLTGGAFNSSAKGVSDDGTIITGYSTSSSGEEAFRWTAQSGMASLGNLPDKSFKKIWANNISADGNVIVGYGDPQDKGWDTYKGFIWTSSEGMCEIGTFDTSKRSMAFCVSANGSIIAGDGGPSAFIWTKESQTKRMGVLPGRTHSRIIGMSTDGKVMIGQSYSLPQWDDEDGFILSEDGMMQSMSFLTGGKYCMVLTVSPDGSVVAGTTNSESSFPAFFWSKEKGFVALGHLPGRNTTHPGDMTPCGKIIVGGSFSGPDSGDAFIWDSIHGMRSLQSVLEKEYGLDLAGWKLQNASAITPDGNVIVGDGINPQGNKEGFRVVLDTTILNVRTGRDLSLQYSTLIGGSGRDYGHGIAVDDSGYVYVAGQANSSDYPTTPGAFDQTFNGSSDILVSKINKNGSALVYSTYIGGSERDNTHNVFADKTGSVYLTGSTASSDFPLTNNSLIGSGEGYILKINATGDSLQYSSWLAGGEKLSLDSEGNLIIIGTTTSHDFPTTESAFSREHRGDQDIFVAKVNLTTNAIIFSTLIGGNGKESSLRMTIDGKDNIIIAGQTTSANFPLKGFRFSDYIESKPNLFLLKLKSDGSDILFSSIIGGIGNDYPTDMAVDQNNNIYVTGMTKSVDFPVSPSAFDKSFNQGDDAFLFKISSDGDSILYSTFIGGSDKDWGRGIVVDKNGRAYLTGCTRSTDFPVSDDAYDKTFNGAGTESWAWGDPFLLVMNPEGTGIEYSTYFGGSNDEEAYGIDIDQNGGVYICGITSSNDFLTTEGAYDRTLNGGTNIYIVKFKTIKDQID